MSLTEWVVAAVGQRRRVIDELHSNVPPPVPVDSVSCLWLNFVSKNVLFF
jgi:hypothetical protein